MHAETQGKKLKQKMQEQNEVLEDNGPAKAVLVKTCYS